MAAKRPDFFTHELLNEPNREVRELPEINFSSQSWQSRE